MRQRATLSRKGGSKLKGLISCCNKYRPYRCKFTGFFQFFWEAFFFPIKCITCTALPLLFFGKYSFRSDRRIFTIYVNLEPCVVKKAPVVTLNSSMHCPLDVPFTIPDLPVHCLFLPPAVHKKASKASFVPRGYKFPIAHDQSLFLPYPVVHTNGSSLSSLGSMLLSASICSMFSLSSRWHRFSVLLISWGKGKEGGEKEGW